LERNLAEERTLVAGLYHRLRVLVIPSDEITLSRIIVIY